MNTSQYKITRNEQKAFRLLANTLILIAETGIMITRDTIDGFSKKIQKQFISLDEALIEIAMKTAAGLKPKDPYKSFSIISEETNAMSTKEFVKYINTFDETYAFLDEYEGWGFTPALSLIVGEIAFSKNCFGRAITIGAVLQERGIKIELGITPDHPYVITYIGDEIYVANAGSDLVKLEGVIQQHEGYKIYRPSENEQKEGITGKIIVLHDFNKAIVYEILENIELLRQISLGNPFSTLPGAQQLGVKLAIDYKNILQGADWKRVQETLFPEIEESLLSLGDEWYDEIDRIAEIREKNYPTHRLNTITKKIRDNMVIKGESVIFAEEVIQATSNDILLFLQKETPFNDSVPEDIKVYFSAIKVEIDKELPEMKNSMVNAIEEILRSPEFIE